MIYLMKMTMYRQCTIIGMNKRSIYLKEVLLILLCFVMAMGVRIFLLASGKITVIDELQYYQNSLISKEQAEPVITSGAAFAYTEGLSDFLRFAGNRLPAVATYHMILQAAAFLFLFLGCRLLFGKTAAFFEALVFALSPWLIKGIGVVSPENFYLFWWSFLFLLIGIFAKRTREKGWYRKNLDETFLTVTGFLTGMVCIWHYTGFFLLLFIAYPLIVNLPSLIERRIIWKKVYNMERLLMDEKAEEDERQEVMPVYSQIMILIMGMLLGGFSTLMKYTGITGEFMPGQFYWWQEQLFSFHNGRWQDLQIYLPIWLMITIWTGAGLQMLLKTVLKKKAEGSVQPEKSLPSEDKSGIAGKTFDKKEKKKKVQNREKDSSVKKETVVEEKAKKEIKYIENPLPLPKKHEKRTLDFKLDKKDGFDVEVDPNDDFDV